MSQADLKHQFQLWWFKRTGKSVEQERTFTTVKKAHRMGVLYRADVEHSEQLMRKVETWAEKHNIRMLAMGFVREKELSGAYTPHRYSDFYCLKHLDRFGLPLETEFVRFSGEDMDYLLNLYCEPDVALMGVSAFSNARFRIGPHLPEYQFCFDAMINCKDQNVMTFADEVLTFLTKFGDGTI
ncbi:MAG: hypothetical protein KDC76_05525 [Bacteroidetes bacterium]|nr:hypothetical protein [Bacteroidota bacterium]